MNDLSIDEIIHIARQFKSLMHRDELAWLCELARLAPDGTGVEIGVYCGASLIAWSLVRRKRGASIGVDDFSFVGMTAHKDGIREECAANLEAAHVRAQLIDGHSVEVARQVENDLAFVFIDGDHRAPAIYDDISAWSGKVMHGGVMAFHDYGRRKNGCKVTEAVDAWQSIVQWHLLGKTETTIGYRKP